MLERWPRPLLIGESGQQQVLQAAAVGKPPFSERELQLILASHAELLPVTHFDPLYGPPVCIGREVATGAGPLDLLYLSPSGYLTVVETKLWKSSEARLVSNVEKRLTLHYIEVADGNTQRTEYRNDAAERCRPT